MQTNLERTKLVIDNLPYKLLVRHCIVYYWITGWCARREEKEQDHQIGWMVCASQ
jgi:hypothetical protein